MKRYIVFFLALTCIVTLTGCADNKKKTTDVTVTNKYFEATVLEVTDSYLLVEPLDEEAERKIADQITVSIGDIGEEQSLNYIEETNVGDIVKIGYHGEVAESYPAQIRDAFAIELISKAQVDYDKI